MQSILASNLPQTSAKLEFKEAYPPMAPTPGNVSLLDALNKGNRILGLPDMGALDPMLRGAGDISFVAEHVDSLSGLGANGSERMLQEKLSTWRAYPYKSKRAALLIEQLVGKAGR
jgi:glutamate carboxypeptidase